MRNACQVLATPAAVERRRPELELLLRIERFEIDAQDRLSTDLQRVCRAHDSPAADRCQEPHHRAPPVGVELVDLEDERRPAQGGLSLPEARKGFLLGGGCGQFGSIERHRRETHLRRGSRGHPSPSREVAAAQLDNSRRAAGRFPERDDLRSRGVARGR